MNRLTILALGNSLTAGFGVIEGVVGQPTGNSVLTQADSVHPTTEGYKIVVETVYPYVLEAINPKREKN